MTASSISSKYPSRCAHDVILCDVCGEAMAGTAKMIEEATAVAAAAKAAAEAWQGRAHAAEAQLRTSCEETYDLKRRVRQLETMNNELRSIGKG